MTTVAIAILFLLMLAAPCVVALRNSRRWDDLESVETRADDLEFDVEQEEYTTLLDAPMPEMRQAATLTDLAIEAEIEAIRAKDLAQETHWAALAAAAKAARLRADAAAEVAIAAGRAADEAYYAADADLIRARAGRRAA